jgi:hypothetical protein
VRPTVDRRGRAKDKNKRALIDSRDHFAGNRVRPANSIVSLSEQVQLLGVLCFNQSDP